MAGAPAEAVLPSQEELLLREAVAGISDLWWAARVARTAPVSREMVLNYVAEHSLGLPKSY